MDNEVKIAETYVSGVGMDTTLFDNFFERSRSRMSAGEVRHGKIEYKHRVQTGYYDVDYMKKSGILPEYYAQFLPNACICGLPIVMNSTMTQIMCSNLRCVSNIASAIEKFCKYFKISGIGPKTAFDMVLYYNYKSILDFFEAPPVEYMLDVQYALKQPVSYAEAVRLLFIPELAAKTETIFKGINSYEEFIKAKAEQYTDEIFFMVRLGGTGKLANSVMELLEAYDWELQHLHEYFNITPPAEEVVYLAITGELNLDLPELGLTRITKDSFIQLINKFYPKYIVFVRTDSVQKADFVIADYPSNSRKYTATLEKFPQKMWTSKNFVGALIEANAFFKYVFGDEKGTAYAEIIYAERKEADRLRELENGESDTLLEDELVETDTSANTNIFVNMIEA